MHSSRDKVTQGQPFKPNAQLHNAFVDELLRQRQLGAGAPYGSARESYLPIFIKSDDEQPPATVVGFGNPIGIVTDAAAGMESAIFARSTPATGRWAVAQQGMFQDERAECTLVGVAWAEVDVTDDAHEWADVDGSGSLVSQTSGYARILYKPAGTGTLWCCLQLGYGGGASGGEVNCSTLRAAYGMPSTTGANPPLRYVGLSGSDGICDFTEIVVCGDQVLAPCAGCTGDNPAFYKLTMSGVSLVDPDPPSNGFDIQAGQEEVLTRSGRCGWDGSIGYHERGDVITDPLSTASVQLRYDEPNKQWYIDVVQGGLKARYGYPVGPHNCMIAHTFTYRAADSDLVIDGYDFGGSTITIDGVSA